MFFRRLRTKINHEIAFMVFRSHGSHLRPNYQVGLVLFYHSPFLFLASPFPNIELGNLNLIQSPKMRFSFFFFFFFLLFLGTTKFETKYKIFKHDNHYSDEISNTTEKNCNSAIIWHIFSSWGTKIAYTIEWNEKKFINRNNILYRILLKIK